MRTENDEWGITESVGVTALGVASGRAMETHRDDGLVDDPYAEDFVDAAAGEIRLPARPQDVPEIVGDGESGTDDWAEQASYIGVRSRFFDEALTSAAADGVRQVVLLAAGLDTRAQRLDWPAGTTVYEVDQQGVLSFKDGVLAERDAVDPAGPVRRVEVRVDLRDDWSAALQEAGFDPATPTAWLAEGLLPYLPAQAEADLFDRVTALSAPGSRIAVEHFGQAVADLADDERFASLARRFGLDVRDLFFDEPRADAEERLAELGWSVHGASGAELAETYGRPADEAVSGLHAVVRLLEGRR